MNEEEVTLGGIVLLTLKLVAGALTVFIVFAALLDQIHGN